MTDAVKPQRRYRSPARRAQAGATRQAIIDAARRLLGSDGYAATTLEAIAGEADVAVQTVYAVFGSKRGILRALLEQGLHTSGSPMAPVLSEAEPRRQLRLAAHRVRQIGERAWDVIEILRSASGADAELAADWRQGEQDRLWAAGALASSLHEKHALRTGLSRAAATDILWGLSTPELYRQLVVARGWKPARFERWLADAWAALLLATDPPAPT